MEDVIKKMMINLNRQKFIFIANVLFLFALNGLLVHNFYYRFIVTGLLNFILVYYLLKTNPYHKKGVVLIFSYFIIVTPFVLYMEFFTNERIPGIISYIIYIISSIFSIWVFKSKQQILLSIIYICIFIFLAINHSNIMNYYMDYGRGNKIIGQQIPLIKLMDSKDSIFYTKGNGKIQVIDIWSNSCGYCIKAFPKFEKLKNDFKNDKEVLFYSINIMSPEKQDNQRAKMYLEKYTFKNYFADISICKKLNFSGVPQYIIIGKDGKIKYIGSLNMEKFETYNNIYDLIENEK